MNNPLLKKANGELTEPPKKPYVGFYPEAIGGGEPTQPNDVDMSNEYTKEVGGYLSKPKKACNYPEAAKHNGDDMSSIYSRQYSGGFFDKFETLEPLKKFVENEMGIKRRASVKVGQRRSKVAEVDGFSEEDLKYFDQKSDAELAQVISEESQADKPTPKRIPRFDKEDKHGIKP
jgi:hypothetical protein